MTNKILLGVTLGIALATQPLTLITLGALVAVSALAVPILNLK